MARADSDLMGAAAPLKFRFETPTANLGLTELRITPGVIDDMAREFLETGRNRGRSGSVDQPGGQVATSIG